MMRAIAAAMLFTLACSAQDDDANDKAPILEVRSPARGTFAESDQVTVTGRVTDEGAVKVTVAGTEVTPAKDGSFSNEPYVGTLENEGTGLAPFHDFDSKVPAELKSELDALKADIISGKIKIASKSQPSA